MEISFDPENIHTLDDLLNYALNAALVKVSATAGSIMLIDQSARQLHVKVRLGPPRQRRVNEPVFEIDGMGIASHVVKTKKSYCSPNAQSDSHYKETQSGPPHFQSLLSVPIQIPGKIFGVLNADHETQNKFTSNDEKNLEKFCGELAKKMADRISVVEAIRRITERLTHESVNGDIEKTLKDIADNIRNALGADVVILYQYDQVLDKFIRTRKGTPTVSGEIWHPEFMQTDVHPGDFPYAVLKQGENIFVSNMDAATGDTTDLKAKVLRRGQPHRDRFCIREGVKSMVALPLIHQREASEKEFVGVLFVNYRSQHIFGIDEKSALATFANAAAFSILAARKEERSRKEKTGLYYRIDPRAHDLLKDKSFLDNFAGREAACFVMAIDIRRSTDLMLNATSPEKYVDFISEVEKRLKESIKQNAGVVDKFTGDGLIAHFPEFFCGSDAGAFCLIAAQECHEAFRTVYREKRSCFQFRHSDVGLGIGIDYGNVHLRMAGQELIAVGTPIVWACRLSAVSGGHTALNQQALDAVSKFAASLQTISEKLIVKNQGDGEITDVRIIKPLSPTMPDWLSNQND
jgi:class 3 adenylate cyclase